MTQNTPRRTFIASTLGVAGGVGFLTSSVLATDDGQVERGPGDLDGGPIRKLLAEAVSPQGQFKLPPLPYDYNALEPAIDAETMQLHHDKHHAAYVKGATEAIENLARLRKGAVAQAAASDWSDKFAFNLGGHLLHCVFWAAMITGGTKPAGVLAADIDQQFGSLENFIEHFSATATQLQGNGWGILVFDPVSRRLLIMQAKNHQLNVAWNAIPLLPLDVWEHAYYLKYRNRRSDYVKAFWSVVNWSAVDQWYGFVKRSHH
jgi:Fe-Mn family superoxide dismutase